jgi:hypothetical protein
MQILDENYIFLLGEYLQTYVIVLSKVHRLSCKTNVILFNESASVQLGLTLFIDNNKGLSVFRSTTKKLVYRKNADSFLSFTIDHK